MTRRELLKLGTLNPGVQTSWDAVYAHDQEQRDEIARLRQMVDESKDQAVLEAIERVAGDDFCEDLDARGSGETLEGDLKIAQTKISFVYRAAHSALRSASCYSVHESWRKETLASLAASPEKPQ